MERIDEIGFGNLRLKQDDSDFCYGIDAVLLSDFAKDRKGKDLSAIDLGTNNGVIPIILSSLTSWHITGVEVKEKGYALAVENMELNGLNDRLRFIRGDILDLDTSKKYDVVLSNPPYMEGGTALKSSDGSKLVSRHETTATLEDFLRVGSELLKDRGDFYLVHRPMRLVDIFFYGRKYDLEPKEVRFVSPHDGAEPNIVLVHYIKGAGKELKILPNLVVHKEDGSYTDDILRIYKWRKENE